jgi:hypothetical protein
MAETISSLLPPGARSKTSVVVLESSGARSNHQVSVGLSITTNGDHPPVILPNLPHAQAS